MSISRHPFMIGQYKSTSHVSISSTTLNKPVKKSLRLARTSCRCVTLFFGSLAGRLSEPSRWFGERFDLSQSPKSRVIMRLRTVLTEHVGEKQSVRGNAFFQGKNVRLSSCPPRFSLKSAPKALFSLCGKVRIQLSCPLKH